MADNDVSLLDQAATPVAFKPRVKDRGNGVREAVHGVSNAGGVQVNPGTEETLVTLGAKVDTLTAAVAALLTNTQLRNSALSVSGPLTDVQLRAASLPVTTGGLTDAQLRASSLPVSGPLTDAQLRASSLPVTTGGLTDAQLRANPLSVLSASSQDSLPANFTRPATATTFASGQAISNNATAGSVTPLGFTVPTKGRIRRVKLAKSTIPITNASFALHLYTAAPTVASGDGVAFSASGALTYLGYTIVTMDRQHTDGATGFSADVLIPYKLPTGTTIYGLLEARGAYASPASEIFTAVLDVD